MAFSRMAIRGDQRAKSFIQVAFEISTSLGSIEITSSLDQTDDQVMYRCQNQSGSAESHTGGIFAESNIPAIVQAGFDKPMLAPDLEPFGGRCLRSGKAGNAEFDFSTGFVGLTPTDPGKRLFETIDLSKPGPSEQIRLHQHNQAISFPFDATGITDMLKPPMEFGRSMHRDGLLAKHRISDKLTATHKTPVTAMRYRNKGKLSNQIALLCRSSSISDQAQQAQRSLIWSVH